MVRSLLLLLLLATTAVLGVMVRPSHVRRPYFTTTDVNRTLTAIENLIRYFDANRGSLIVDSMWGIRMIQGKANVSGRRFAKFFLGTLCLPSGGLESTLLHAEDPTPELMTRVSSISRYAREVAARGIYYAKRNAAVQYGKFSELLSQPFVYQNLLSGALGRVDSGNV